ncbi:Na+:solute symporter [candidate division WOR-3 bacterium]|nr:Na+:solute symporter [candidate division WOR-3 bacterium]
MNIVDIGIIIAYFIIVVAIGIAVRKMASQDIRAYFLGGNKVPFYILGLANASGMFDVTGTMMLVTWLFVYGIKGAFLPWVWPVFNQIFLMVFLAKWLRRSNVITGAEWIKTRFGHDMGAKLSDISVVAFAIISTIGFLAYAFQGIGKFSQIFLPWELSANTYGIIIMSVASVYTIMGGLFAVLVTDVFQFFIMTVVSVFIAYIAITNVTREAILSAIPAGWDSLTFGWTNLSIDWSNLMPTINSRIATDGFSLAGIVLMMMLFKGVLVSGAGPAPNYDMQKILATKTPREASLMSGVVTVVLFLPRYLLVTGICVLGLVFFSPQLNSMGAAVDFEQIFPYVVHNFVPVGLTGLILAGLISAFMSTYDGTLNCGASYIVNDIYKRYINKGASEKKYVMVSYLSTFLLIILGFIFGMLGKSIHQITMWIVSGLWGGYVAPNVLKWYWWRFNGYGFFWGMVSGMAAAMILPLALGNPDVLFGIQTNLALFPLVLLISTAASIIGTLTTAPEKDEVLMDFYKKVRPWGLWKPVYEKVKKADPNFERNKDFFRDTANVIVGTVWQMTFVLIPIYLIIKQFTGMWINIGVLAVTSIFLKFNWYDKLEKA